MQLPLLSRWKCCTATFTFCPRCHFWTWLRTVLADRADYVSGGGAEEGSLSVGHTLRGSVGVADRVYFTVGRRFTTGRHAPAVPVDGITVERPISKCRDRRPAGVPLRPPTSRVFRDLIRAATSLATSSLRHPVAVPWPHRASSSSMLAVDRRTLKALPWRTCCDVMSDQWSCVQTSVYTDW